MKNCDIDKARRAFREGNLEEALDLIDDCPNENEESVFLKGEIFYNLQKWGESLNQFRRCLEMNPDDKAAQTYVGMILNILSFFHSDQFNP